jgi:hypothetical protein
VCRYIRRRNQPRAFFARCISDASAETTFVSVASAMQMPKQLFCPLHQRCKRQNNFCALCINDASAKTTFVSVASAMQAPKQLLCPLHQRCKRQNNFCALCISDASVKTTFLPFYLRRFVPIVAAGQCFALSSRRFQLAARCARTGYAHPAAVAATRNMLRGVPKKSREGSSRRIFV